MKIYENFAFDKMADAVEKLLQRPDVFAVFQKFSCGNCMSRQTIDQPNRLFTHGRCDACGCITDLTKSGCNYAVVKRIARPASCDDDERVREDEARKRDAKEGFAEV